MRQIRRNVFETNSSSSHSLSVSDTSLVLNDMPIVENWDMCDGEPTLMVELTGFCSMYDHDSQNDKLAYLIEQIAYITDNEYANGWYGSIAECEAARERLYETEEFKELEDEICNYVGCKHLRIRSHSSGYIDHDSVMSDIEDLKLYDIPSCAGGYAGFVFACDSNVHFEFNG